MNLITSSVFHYEFEFIHPFADGNGRMGRFWQSLILTRWKPLFADIPVESLVHEHQVRLLLGIAKEHGSNRFSVLYRIHAQDDS
jgi:fido (protein-threonine AMPylation protein)